MDLNLPQGMQAEEDKDVLGGNLLESGVYRGIVDLVYLDSSDSGARCVVIHFREKESQKVIKNTIFISNKKGEFTYISKQDGKPYPLPGYSQMNTFFNVATGKGIGEQQTETKMINVYNFKEAKDKPKEVQVFTDLSNTEVAIGILKVSEEKTKAQSSNPSNPPYTEGTGEFIDKNEFSKFFNTDGTTLSEKVNNKPAEFISKWKNKNDNKTVVRKAKVPGTASANNGATAGAPAPSTTTKLF